MSERNWKPPGVAERGRQILRISEFSAQAADGSEGGGVPSVNPCSANRAGRSASQPETRGPPLAAGYGRLH